MKLSYDKETDSLYIHLSNTPSVDSDETGYVPRPKRLAISVAVAYGWAFI